MAKADIWMPLFIGDYLADTTRLTTEQHGAYLLLIMDYWRNGPAPDDDAILANITKLAAKDWKRVKPALVGFFQVDGGAWKHGRIERELTDASKSKEKAEQKAKKAAEARWAKEASSATNKHASGDAPSNATSMPQAMPEQCPSPSPLPIKAKSTAESAPATRLPADWKPRQDEIEFCKTERPDLNPMATADRFRDYWVGVPGVKGRKADWTATWRNWVRNEKRSYDAGRDADRRRHANDRTAAAAAVFGDGEPQDRRIIDVN
jgi:uncharacterized protein YdaU (DUF1376 family)